MKNIYLILSILTMAFLMSCSNDDGASVDCSQSDLSVSVSGTVDPDCPALGSFEVTGSGGTAPYTFSINETDFQDGTTFSDLSAGSFTVTVMDADGCTATTTATLTEQGDAVIVSLTATDSDCGNPIGTITATASGGDGTYTFSLDGGSTQGSGDFSGVSSGSHDVTVIDGTGCSTTESIVVSSGTSWSSQISSILSSNCAVSGCHNGDNGANRNWTVFSNVQSNASSIKSRTEAGTMPPAGSGQSLSASEIALIACWVDDGAPQN